MLAGSVVRVGGLPGTRTGDFGRKGGSLACTGKREVGRAGHINLSLVGSGQLFGCRLRSAAGSGGCL